MRYIISGKNIDITPGLKEAAESKIGKLAGLLVPEGEEIVLQQVHLEDEDLTTGSLLIEMGGHANTLEEAKYSGRLVGQALAALFADG